VNVSTSEARYNVNDSGSSKVINYAVQTFNTSFGTVHLVPSMFVNIDAATGLSTPGSGLVLNMAMLELQFMKGNRLHTEDLPRNAGGRNGYAKCIFSLCNKNPRGMGKLTP
jgi:hypothetical protein